MTVIALLEFTVRTDRLADADAIITETLDVTRGRPGCEGVEVVRGLADPARIVVVERWASVADDDAYRAFRATAEGASRLGEIVTEPPSLSRFSATTL